VPLGDIVRLTISLKFSGVSRPFCFSSFLIDSILIFTLPRSLVLQRYKNNNINSVF